MALTVLGLMGIPDMNSLGARILPTAISYLKVVIRSTADPRSRTVVTPLARYNR